MASRKFYLLLAIFCIVKLTLHLIGDYNSGFQGDELLHIETGNHPAFGYMEFPPVIGWLAYVQNLLGSTSIFAHHIFSHLASLGIIVLLGFITRALGGKNRAVFIVLLCVLISPGFGRSQQLFQPVVFSQFFWILSFFQLVRYIKTLDNRYLLYLTICAALGFLTKYDIVFFIAGLVSLLFFDRTRKSVIFQSFWKYVLLFLVLVSPNILWQWQHDFPLFQMFSRLYETQLDQLKILGVITDFVVSLNPLTAPIWIGGLVYMFWQKTNRPLACSILISILFLAFSESKFYYFFPVGLVLLVFGGLWVEQKILTIKQCIIYPITFLLLLSGVIMIPFGLAILPVKPFIEFAAIEKEGNVTPVPYIEYYSQSKWDKTLSALKVVYDSIPAEEQKTSLIWGKHYSQAGAVKLFQDKYDLPDAFSYHGSFYLWAPDEGKLPKTIIAYTNGEAKIDFFEGFFKTVTPVKKIYNPYADFEEDIWQTIYICKNPKQDFKELKLVFENRVFE